MATHAAAAPKELDPKANDCPLCAKDITFVKDVRYCARCRIAGIGVDGKDDDALPGEAMSKLKKVAAEEKKAA